MYLRRACDEDIVNVQSGQQRNRVVSLEPKEYDMIQQYPEWADDTCTDPIPTVMCLQDCGFRYQDCLVLPSGWIYKVTGDLHSAGQILVEPDWAPSSIHPSRHGLAQVRHHRWPDASPVKRLLGVVNVPLYGRRSEAIDPMNVLEVQRPEAAAKRIASYPETEGERKFGRLYSMLSIEAKVVPDCIGISGSYAKGLARPESDFDIDVYGASSSVQIAAAAARLVSIPGSGWHRPWPPNRYMLLYYLHISSYSERDADWLWDKFEASGRDWFNYTFEGTRLTLFYHGIDRSRTSATVHADFDSFARISTYRGVAVIDKDLNHLAFPSFIQLEDVRCIESGRYCGNRCVVSWSKGFYYCRTGDVVVFRACQPRFEDSRFLVIPDFGVDWPVQITEFAD